MPAFFDVIFENNQDFFRFFYPFCKNLINLVGVIKLGVNFPNCLIGKIGKEE